MKTRIYIDWANLHNGFKRFGVSVDYSVFKLWLSQKYQTEEIYAFIGYIESNVSVYQALEDCGYILVLKETKKINNKYKGNCDTEITLRIISDFYEKLFDRAVLVTSDGDFACVVNFLLNKSAVVVIMTPNLGDCSVFLRRTNVPIVDLSQHAKKFTQKEKTSAEDVSKAGPFPSDTSTIDDANK